MKIFSSDVKLRILKLANADKSISEISSITNIPEGSVRSILREFGVKARRGSNKRVDVSAKTEFLRLYRDEHLNAAEIARRTGYSHSTVKTVIKDAKSREAEISDISESPTVFDEVNEVGTDAYTCETQGMSLDGYITTDESDSETSETTDEGTIRVLNTVHKRGKLNSVCAVDKEYNGTNHVYEIFRNTSPSEDPIATIRFQKGARFEDDSTSGVSDMDLLEIVRDRLIGFQTGEFACTENDRAIQHIEEAIMWLNYRAENRMTRGVFGKNEA